MHAKKEAVADYNFRITLDPEAPSFRAGFRQREALPVQRRERVGALAMEQFDPNDRQKIGCPVGRRHERTPTASIEKDRKYA